MASSRISPSSHCVPKDTTYPGAGRPDVVANERSGKHRRKVGYMNNEKHHVNSWPLHCHNLIDHSSEDITPNNKHRSMRPFLEEMADMPIPLYGYDAPPTLADRPHAREHQHMTYLQYLARKQPDPAQYPNYPDVDIRDGVSHYLIEIECPGVKNAADIHCQWTSRRHLTVSGTVGRPEYVPVVSEDRDPIALMPKLCREKDIPAQQQENGKAKERPVYLILGERRIGSFRRNFTFPVDVEQEQMSAKLEAGLLRIVLPKKQHHVPQGTGKVNIEVVE